MITEWVRGQMRNLVIHMIASITAYAVLVIMMMGFGNWTQVVSAQSALNMMVIFAFGLEFGQNQMKYKHKSFLTWRDVLNSFADFLSWIFFPLLGMAVLCP